MPYASVFRPDLFAGKVAAGGTPQQTAEWSALVFNNRLNTTMVTLFVVLVTVILTGCAREWWLLVRGRKQVVLHEAAYVPIPEV